MDGDGVHGMACACDVLDDILTQGVCSELALIDVASDKLRAEKMDLADGQAFMRHRTKLSADTGTTWGVIDLRNRFRILPRNRFQIRRTNRLR